MELYPLYIDTVSQLERFVEAAMQDDAVAIDTEFIRERTYYPKLCLIQVATRSQCAVIDPLAIDDLSAFARLLGHPDTQKVFHAPAQDMEVLLHAIGAVPDRIFDTQAAASLLGFRSQPGYASLVEHYSGVHLSKTESLTDWSRRPLDDAQLQYALDDVRYLLPIYDEMREKLTELGRLEWLVPEFEELLDVEPLGSRPRCAYERVKKISSLSRTQLGVAREVAAWRETTAMKRDIPRRWVLSDELVVEISKRAPRTIDKLKRIRGAETISIPDQRALIQAVETGAAVDPADLPETKRRHRPSPTIDPVVDLMYAMLRIVSEESGVASQSLATRDDLVRFAEDRTGPLAQGWRKELLGDRLVGLLTGELALSVEDCRIVIR